MTNIILIGFMGCGKTTFGRWLSHRQQMDFVDTDAFIEKLEGRSVQAIFATEGEEYFRRLETRVLRMFLGEEGEEYRICKSTVISAGGGLPVRRKTERFYISWERLFFWILRLMNW